MKCWSHGWKTGGNDTGGHLDRDPAYGSGKCIGWILGAVGEEDSEAVDRGKNNAVMRISTPIVDEHRDTYKKPRPNAIVRANFSIFCSFKPQTWGMGRIKVARSLAIVDVALAAQVPTWLMHLPGSWGYQSFCTGTQMKMKRKVIHITQATMKVPMTNAHLLK
jgi:hypothetical protein